MLTLAHMHRNIVRNYLQPHQFAHANELGEHIFFTILNVIKYLQQWNSGKLMAKVINIINV